MQKKKHQRKLHSYLGIKITQRELEKHLWEASNILRGSVDASEYKYFIFGLLFLKRLNDVFDEKVEKIIQETEDPETASEDPDEHDFFIPREARWSSLHTSSLVKVCKAIEQSNPSLKGVLSLIGFAANDRLSKETLNQLIQHFGSLRLRNCDLSDPDILGRSYEYLVVRFAETAGKKGGEFYSPHMVVKLLVELLQPEESMWICDPTVGSGGMLIQCSDYIRRNGGNWQNLSLYGQEKNHSTWAICKMNMILHGIVDSQIEKGDTIRDPKLVQDGHLLLFDIVIANPPYSLSNWGFEIAENDFYNRFRFGIPSRNYGDLAFLQHMLATLRPSGRMGVILPHGVLFRGGAERKIRKALIDNDLIEAIIGLAPNLFYGTSIPAVILLINKKKRSDQKGKILFIDAFEAYKEEKAQNFLQEKDVKKIVRIYKNFESTKKFSRIVSLKEIRNFDFNLNIPLYVETIIEEDPVDISQVISELSKLRKLEKDHMDISQKIKGLLDDFSELKEQTVDQLPDTWYMVNLGEQVILETGKRAKGGALKEGIVASIGGEHIFESGYIEWEKNMKFIPEEFYDKSLTQGKVRLDDILVVKDGATTGKVALVRKLPYAKVAVNEHVFIVRSKDTNKLDSHFLFYLLFSSLCQNQIKRRFHGVVGGINRSDFKTIRIPLPPLAEQKNIVDILSAVVTRIETTQRIYKETNRLKKGLMQQLLTGKIRKKKY
ncbi:MAG: N-6 DNA methylase [Candidatus Hodarchaeales archaeon]|jgi:type I restriction enzyme M protein